MAILRRSTLAGLLVASALGLRAAEPEGRGEAVFRQLAALVGTWEGTFANGRKHTVTYRLTAGGSVLVETWALGPGRESMTLYHLDGAALLATHYCPQGNQPRLQLAPGPEPGRFAFAFKDGTNLQAPGKSHQHAFWLELKGPRSFVRSETYVENGRSEAGLDSAKPDPPVTYTRVEAATSSRLP